MDIAKLESHLRYLQSYHDDLDQQIERDHSAYKDDRLIAVMKKKKLALRDEIESVKRQLEQFAVK